MFFLHQFVGNSDKVHIENHTSNCYIRDNKDINMFKRMVNALSQESLDTFIRRTHKYALIAAAFAIVLGVILMIIIVFQAGSFPQTIMMAFMACLAIMLSIWFLTAIAALIYTLKFDGRHMSHIIRLAIIIIAALIRYFTI